MARFRLLTKISRKTLVLSEGPPYFGYMLKKPAAQRQELELDSIEALVPEQHLLRKVDAAVDFSFTRDRVKHLYCEDNGRPALDPVVLFKLLLLGYLSGVRSERRPVSRHADVIPIAAGKQSDLSSPTRGFLSLLRQAP